MEEVCKTVICGPISRPLKTARQLLHWRQFIGNEREYSVPNIAFARPPESNLEHQTLVCHDMRGGYLEDSYNDGHTNMETYRFYNWSLINYFCYFSHHLVTIPPLAWITAAHRNGVRCMGTFIVEGWSSIQEEGDSRSVSGRDILLEILRDSESVKQYAQCLIEIAEHFNFDGWLVNIEVNVPREKVRLLLQFCKLLTNGMHRMLDGESDLFAGQGDQGDEELVDENFAIEDQKDTYKIDKFRKDAAVIWYDSVTTSGWIEYQNSLTRKNYEFFDATDGIFLNYWWQPELLKRSVMELNHYASEKLRRYRIFAGIDVHGRSTFGGGKWTTYVASRAIQEQKVSTAVFAPAWTFENFCDQPGFDFQEYEQKFWSYLYPFLMNSETKISSLPISTTFCHGVGKEGRFISGTKEGSSGSWFDLSKMQLQPSFCANSRQSLNRSFHGGTCRRLSTKLGEEFILFRTDINFSPKTSYEMTLAYEYPDSVFEFMQFNGSFLKDLEHLFIFDDKYVQEKFSNGWTQKKMSFTLRNPVETFHLKTISIKLPKLPGDSVCYLGLFELKQVEN